LDVEEKHRFPSDFKVEVVISPHHPQIIYVCEEIDVKLYKFLERFQDVDVHLARRRSSAAGIDSMKTKLDLVILICILVDGFKNNMRLSEGKRPPALGKCYYAGTTV
jgi:hypothetical protein